MVPRTLDSQELKSNNKVLMTMADMQEKARGAFVFDRAYVHLPVTLSPMG